MRATPPTALSIKSPSETARRLAIALGLTLAFVILETLAGFWANSLALLTDAAHNFTDVIALALSWYGLYLATRPAHAGKTFGYHRAGILIALLNSTTLVIIALGIFYEAYQRLLAPPPVRANFLIIVGSVAFLLNIGTALLVRPGSQQDLNLRSAFLHLWGDALSTFAAILAGIAITFTGLYRIDPLVSILIGFLIIWNAWGILRESVHILLESTPLDIDVDQMVKDILTVPGVRSVHDLHVWSINSSVRALSVHVLSDDIAISAGANIQQEVNELLRSKYAISHATLQLECVGCAPDLLYCNMVNTKQASKPDSHPD